MLHLESLLMDSAANDPWCGQCCELRQQLETVQNEHVVNFKALKEKIFSTDLLIKKYNTKCKEYDAQTKKLEETTKRVEGYQRDFEMMTAKLKASFEQLEPLNQTNEKLEKKKASLEKQVEQLTSRLSSSELIQKQYMLTQKKLDKEVTDLEAERTQLKQTVKDVEASLKKTESSNKKLQEDRLALFEQKKLSTRLTKTNQKLENQLAKCEELFRLNGLYVDFKKIVRRSGGSNSEVCSITSSIAHTADLLSEEEDTQSESDEDVERIFQALGFSSASHKPRSSTSKVHLKPILPALSPLPCSPAPVHREESSDSDNDGGIEGSSGGRHGNDETMDQSDTSLGASNATATDMPWQPVTKYVDHTNSQGTEQTGPKPSKAASYVTRFQRNSQLAAQASKLRSQRVRKLETIDDDFTSRRHSKTVVMKPLAEEVKDSPVRESHSVSSLSKDAVAMEISSDDSEERKQWETDVNEGTSLFSPKQRRARVLSGQTPVEAPQNKSEMHLEKPDETEKVKDGETHEEIRSLAQTPKRSLSKQSSGSFDIKCLDEDIETTKSSEKPHLQQADTPHEKRDQKADFPANVERQVEEDLEISTSEDEFSPNSPRRYKSSPRILGSPKSPIVSTKVNDDALLGDRLSLQRCMSPRRSSPRLQKLSESSTEHIDMEQDIGDIEEISDRYMKGSDDMLGSPKVKNDAEEELSCKSPEMSSSGEQSDVAVSTVISSNRRRTRSLSKSTASLEDDSDSFKHVPTMKKSEEERVNSTGTESNKANSEGSKLSKVSKQLIQPFKEPLPVGLAKINYSPKVRLTRSKSVSDIMEKNQLKEGPKHIMHIDRDRDMEIPTKAEKSKSGGLSENRTGTQVKVTTKENLLEIPMLKENLQKDSDKARCSQAAEATVSTTVPLHLESPYHQRVAEVKRDEFSPQTPEQMSPLPFSPQSLFGGLPSVLSPLPPTPLRREESVEDVDTDTPDEPGTEGANTGSAEVSEVKRDGNVKGVSEISRRTTQLIDVVPMMKPKKRRRGRKLKEEMNTCGPKSTQPGQNVEKDVAGNRQEDTRGVPTYKSKPLISFVKGQDMIPGNIDKEQTKGNDHASGEAKDVTDEPGMHVKQDIQTDPDTAVHVIGGSDNTGNLTEGHGSDVTEPATVLPVQDLGDVAHCEDLPVKEALEQDVKPSVSVSPATTAGVEETLTTCTTPTKKNKKERHKKKRKREALEALSESHPLKKTFVCEELDESTKQYIKVIDRELQALERVGPVNIMQTANHLVSLKQVVDTQRFAERMLQLLEKNDLDILMDEVRGQLKSLESDPGISTKWRPALAKVEERVVELVEKMGEAIPNLPDLFLSTSAERIVHSDSLNVLSKSSLCRVYAATCRKLGQVERLRVLVYDLTYFKVTGVYVLLANCAEAWPEALQRTGNLEVQAQPLITVLQAIFLKNQFFRGTPKQSVGIGVLKLLCRWEYLDLQHTELVTMVMERINNTIRDSSMDVTKLETDQLHECLRSLLLFAVHKGWEWTYTHLIQNTVWPKVLECIAACHGDQPHHVTRLKWMCKLLGFLAVQCPKSEREKVDDILKSLQEICLEDSSVSFSVETRQSLLETVMLLTPYNIALGTDICQKLLKVDEGTHNPQIKDKILKHLNYFKQRLPYNSV